MAELRPYPLADLVRRMFRELDAKDSIFDLPRRSFYLGDEERSFDVSFHGRRASTPLGPAAGPQSQMAQNIVLSWLGGSRILELKTVQIKDELAIPRPCIDMQTVGYNVEWSQELKLEQSLDEYVKGHMLIEILRASGRLELVGGFEDTVYDMSVGYDLEGIKSPRVEAFVDGMLDCSEVVDRMRVELSGSNGEFATYRDLDYASRLSDTLTLSTFHGCPPDEIESIIDYLLREKGLNCIVKLNPMLLGPERAREILHSELGYEDMSIPDTAFTRDTRWEQALGFVERLGETARGLGLGFGVKFSNTLIVENKRQFFPDSEREMYLSGRPLHVLAMNLVARFREHFGNRYPISFSAGIERKNFPDAVALGLVPVTVCTDFLRPRGYARSRGYFEELVKRMDAVGARSVDEFVQRAYGNGASSVEEALLLNTQSYVSELGADPLYHASQNAKLPKKIGSQLVLFDCISCDKCIPVCPNDANFTLNLPPRKQPIVKLRREKGAWQSRTDGELVLEEKHQIANFADFCNDCGNCDVFCPDDGGPYIVKPRFFRTLEDWRHFATYDGFSLQKDQLWGRVDGLDFSLESVGDRVRFEGPGFSLTLDPKDPVTTLEGTATKEVDLTYLHIMCWMRDAVYASDTVNYLNCL